MRSVEETLQVLDQLGTAAQLMAGGTDVMIQLRHGQITPEVLLDIHGLPGLGEIGVNGRLSVGALVTHRALVTSPLVDDRFQAIGSSAAQVGGWQTQAVGTLVGNIANASPAADTVPALLVHDARVRLASVDGEREVPLTEFIVGRRRTERKPNELIVSISADVPPQGSRDAFVKVGRRSAMEVSIVAVAARLTVDGAGTISEARIAVAAASEVPYRAVAAERTLVGQVPGPELLGEAAIEASLPAAPIDDMRASRRYRTAVLPGAIRRALQECLSEDQIERGS